MAYYTKITLLPSLFLLSLFFYNQPSSFTVLETAQGQRTNTVGISDTLAIQQALSRLQNIVFEKGYDRSKTLEELDLLYERSSALYYNRGMVDAALIAGGIFKSEAKYTQALDYYLKANNVADMATDPGLRYHVYAQTSLLYQDWKVYQKAEDFLYKALVMTREMNDVNLEMKTLQSLSLVARAGSNPEKASAYLYTLRDLAASHKEPNMEGVATEALISLYLQAQHYDSAQLACTLMLNKAIANGDRSNMIYYYNKSGIIFKNQKLYEPALKAFSQAFDLMRQEGFSEKEMLSVMLSMGVMQQLMGENDKAVTSFENAYRVAQQAGDEAETVKVLNYLIALKIALARNDEALRHIEELIGIAENRGDLWNLEKNYLRMAGLEEAAGRSKKALSAYKKYLEVRDKLYEQEKERQNELLARQLEAEKKEKELRLLVVDQELQTLALQKLQADAQKKEQELVFLQQQQELQETKLKTEQLEKEQVQQALVLAEEKLKAEKRKQELEALQRERELQELAFRQKELEEQEKAQAFELLQKNNALLEADKKLQQQLLEEEAAIRKYGIGILGLVLLVLFTLIFGFVQKQKANKALKTQQARIERQNVVLAANERQLKASMEELETANEMVEAQKSDLEAKNLRLTDSIKYAERIQTAILPAETKILNAFADYFYLFMPKDVVSGDFYWFSQVEDTAFIASVDCTGHGVPGAFMSMIGNTLLNQIVNERRIESTAEILSVLHESVRDSLNQKDSNNVDGMDIAICSIKPLGNERFKVAYSGAKCALMYVQGGKVQSIKPDRMSIGGWHRDVSLKFQQHELLLQRGDALYLPTDGIIDIANENRQRLGTKALKNLIEKHAHRPFYEQKLQIENFVGEYQQHADQRDDITLVAVKL